MEINTAYRNYKPTPALIEKETEPERISSLRNFLHSRNILHKNQRIRSIGATKTKEYFTIHVICINGDKKGYQFPWSDLC